jgi:hypothetical protein
MAGHVMTQAERACLLSAARDEIRDRVTNLIEKPCCCRCSAAWSAPCSA